MTTHVIIRSIPGEAYLPGDEVDATLWRNAPKLVGMRYLRPLNKDELRARPTTRERIAIKAEAREAAAAVAVLEPEPEPSTEPEPVSEPEPPRGRRGRR